MVQQWFLYRLSDGYIQNKIEYDSEVDVYQPPEGFAMILAPEGLKGKWSMCGIGWTYKDNKFIEPARK